MEKNDSKKGLAGLSSMISDVQAIEQQAREQAVSAPQDGHDKDNSHTVNRKTSRQKQTSTTNVQQSNGRGCIVSIVLVFLLFLFFAVVGGRSSTSSKPQQTRTNTTNSSSATPKPPNSSSKKTNETPSPKKNVATGYDDNHLYLNDNGFCEITIDNTKNDMPVYVRIWDMNMRGFIREHVLNKYLSSNSIKSYSPSVTGLERANKCDLVLKNKNDSFVRFQVKGLTWKGCRLKGENTEIDCETQLSRGRVNDHPTQSRLYLDTDFEYLIIAVDPPYSNTLSLETYVKSNYNWEFYCIPMSRLRKHPKYNHRVFSHQYISYQELQRYRIRDSWFDLWKKE